MMNEEIRKLAFRIKKPWHKNFDEFVEELQSLIEDEMNETASEAETLVTEYLLDLVRKDNENNNK